MINLLLASSGEWFKVAIVIFSLFAGVIILANVYSKITEKGNVKDKDGCGWPVFIVLVTCIVGILINMKSCKGCSSSRDYNYDPVEYQRLK